jgi:hypothetical protein
MKLDNTDISILKGIYTEEVTKCRDSKVGFNALRKLSVFEKISGKSVRGVHVVRVTYPNGTHAGVLMTNIATESLSSELKKWYAECAIGDLDSFVEDYLEDHPDDDSVILLRIMADEILLDPHS